MGIKNCHNSRQLGDAEHIVNLNPLTASRHAMPPTSNKSASRNAESRLFSATNGASNIRLIPPQPGYVWRMCSSRTWTQVCGAGIARSLGQCSSAGTAISALIAPADTRHLDAGGAELRHGRGDTYQVSISGPGWRGGDCLCCDQPHDVSWYQCVQ